MNGKPLVSTVISSYNYAGFLPHAIDSALKQTYANVEVIVVDDGSSDNSREVITSYGSHITPVLKENGGQASALNTGFRRSKGDILLFLDSDDVLLPEAARKAVEYLADPEVVKAHWRMWEVDERGQRTGKLHPAFDLDEGDLRARIVARGPHSHHWPSTSGNAWSRFLLSRLFPIPEREYVTCPDHYLCELAPLFGPLRRVDEPLSCYRRHGGNHINSVVPTEEFRLFEHARQMLRCYGEELGLDLDPGGWRGPRYQWLRRLADTARQMAELIPAGQSFIFVDENHWGRSRILIGRQMIPFLEKDGQYWGRPADDAVAVRELERLRTAGAGFLVFAWPAFWWFDYYGGFHRSLRTRFRCLLQTDSLVIFDLR